MKKFVGLVIGAGIAIVIAGLILVTNADDIAYSGIEDTVSKIEFETSTISRITNDYAVDTDCEYASVAYGAIGVWFIGHSDWFYQNFGDIHEEYKEKYINEFAGMRGDSEEVQSFLLEYADKLKTRINPSILEKYSHYENLLDVDLYFIETWSKKSDCSDVFLEPLGAKIDALVQESLEIVGYDASDTTVLVLHDGLFSDGPGTSDPWDGNDADGLIDGERIAIYVQNQSAQRVTLVEVSLAGIPYTYRPAITLNAFTSATLAPGDFVIITKGLTTAAVSKAEINAELEAGEEATIMVELDGGISLGRDAQFKIETANGAVFVGTIIAGQQSG